MSGLYLVELLQPNRRIRITQCWEWAYPGEIRGRVLRAYGTMRTPALVYAVKYRGHRYHIHIRHCTTLNSREFEDDE